MDEKEQRSVSPARKIATLGVLTALSLITFIIENQFPPLIIPGAKMGLANIFSFAALIIFSPVEAFVVVAVRTALGAVFAGNFSAVIYSFSGGVISMGVSSVLLYLVHPRVSVMAVSVAAAVAHNITQNCIFALMSGTALAFYYIPYLIFLGVISGAIVGAVIMLSVKKIPSRVFGGMIFKR